MATRRSRTNLSQPCTYGRINIIYQARIILVQFSSVIYQHLPMQGRQNIARKRNYWALL